MAAAQGDTQRTAWLRGGTRGALGGVTGTPVPPLALTSAAVCCGMPSVFCVVSGARSAAAKELEVQSSKQKRADIHLLCACARYGCGVTLVLFR